MNPSDPSVIEDWLKNFTYKPGFNFEYFPPHRLRGSYVSMHAGVVKIWTPHRRVFTFQIDWHLFSGEEHFKRWLRHHVELLRELEWDPHASNRR